MTTASDWARGWRRSKTCGAFGGAATLAVMVFASASVAVAQSPSSARYEVEVYLERAEAIGAPALEEVFSFVESSGSIDTATFDAALSDILPGVSNALAAQNGIRMNRRFSDLMSCPQFVGQTAVMEQSSCAWFQTSGGGLTMTEKDGVTGYSDGNFTFAFGGQYEFADDWYFGLAASYARDWLRSDDSRVISNADTVFVGATVKWEVIERAVIGVALGGTYSWLDNERRILGTGRTADSNPDFWSGAARIHMEYEFALDGPFYLLPYQDFDFVYTVTPAYSENGAGAFNLDVDKGSQVSFSSNKALEIGGRMRIAQGLLLKSYASAGVTIGNHQDWTTTASLASGPAGAGDFSSTIPIDKYYGRVGAGFHLQGTDGLDIRLEYDGAVSGHSDYHIGSLRLGYRF